MNHLFRTLLILLLAASAALAQFPQIESEVPSADPAPTLIAYGQWSAGSISGSTDIDIFQFLGAPGDFVVVSLAGLTANLDPIIRLIDPSGMQLDSWSCSSTAFTCSVAGSETLAVGGVFTLVVEDLGSDNSGNYQLGIERTPPATGVPMIPANFTWTDSLGPSRTDQDFVSFTAQPGDQMQVNLNGLTANLDLRLLVYAPDGTVFHSQSCNSTAFTCSLSATLAGFTQAGTYYLRFSDVGIDNTGSYQCTLNCIFGPSCPLPFSSYPGSGEDLVIATSLNGSVPVTFPDTKPATGGDTIEIAMWSPGGTFTNCHALMVADVRPSGTPAPMPTGFPAVHVDFGSFILWDSGVSILGNGGLSYAGINLSVATPQNLAGFDVILQGLVLDSAVSTGLLVSTDAHEFNF